MGQISLPVLNRTGYSTFWQSVWDDKYNHNRGWKEDYYFRRLVPYLFSDQLSKSDYLVNYKTITNSKTLINYKHLGIFDEPLIFQKKLLKVMWNKRRVKLFILRIWIIKFSSWIIFFFKMHTPYRKSNRKIQEQSVTDMSNYMGYYHIHNSLAKFNKKHFNDNSYNKYNF